MQVGTIAMRNSKGEFGKARPLLRDNELDPKAVEKFEDFLVERAVTHFLGLQGIERKKKDPFKEAALQALLAEE